MNKFKFLLVFCGLLLVTGTFNVSYGVADETASDSSQMTDQMDEGYDTDSMVQEDDAYYDDAESNSEYQEDSASYSDEEPEGSVEETEDPSDI